MALAAEAKTVCVRATAVLMRGDRPWKLVVFICPSIFDFDFQPISVVTSRQPIRQLVCLARPHTNMQAGRAWMFGQLGLWWSAQCGACLIPLRAHVSQCALLFRAYRHRTHVQSGTEQIHAFERWPTTCYMFVRAICRWSFDHPCSVNGCTKARRRSVPLPRGLIKYRIFASRTPTFFIEWIEKRRLSKINRRSFIIS